MVFGSPDCDGVVMILGDAVKEAAGLLRMLEEDGREKINVGYCEAGIVFIIAKIYGINADVIQDMIHMELYKQ